MQTVSFLCDLTSTCNLIYFRIIILADIDNMSLEFWSLIICDIAPLPFLHTVWLFVPPFEDVCLHLLTNDFSVLSRVNNKMGKGWNRKPEHLATIYICLWLISRLVNNTSHFLQLQIFPFPNPDIISGNIHNFAIIHREESTHKRQRLFLSNLPKLSSITSE